MSERIPVVEAAVNPAPSRSRKFQRKRRLLTFPYVHSTRRRIWRVGITTATWAIREIFPTRAACKPPCTAAGCGRCASTRAWATPRNRTSVTISAGKRNDGAVSGLRFADADRPRFGQSAGRGRSGQGGRGHRFDRGHAAAVRWHRPDQISTSMTINATASILLALYVAVARRQGMDIRKLSGTVQNDVLKEYIARGTYIYPPQQAMRIITTFLPGRMRTCRTGIRFRFPAITCARRDRRRCRKSPLRWATGSPM